MRLLLTNDDGIEAEGLKALEAALSQHFEVVVCAPDSERSATSHAIHLRGPVRIRRRDANHFDTTGTPADCVLLAAQGTRVGKFDVVVSGINHGPNLGTDVVYSGTCAAARQGALSGYPAVAVSLASFTQPLDFTIGAQWLAENLEHLVASCPSGCFVNVNLPGKPRLPLQAVRVAPVVRRYFDKVVEFIDPRGEVHCFVDGLIREDSIPENTDWSAVRGGLVALTLMPAQPASCPWPGESV